MMAYENRGKNVTHAQSAIENTNNQQNVLRKFTQQLPFQGWGKILAPMGTLSSITTSPREEKVGEAFLAG
jgi:hypothetical protein